MRASILRRVLALSALTSSSSGFVPGKPCPTRRGTDVTMAAQKDTSAEDPAFGRRKALQTILGGGVAFVASTGVNALDMDSFVNSQLDSDTKNCDPKRDSKCIPKLSSDEALCKYGQSGNARGEACKRVKAAGGELPKASKEKSLGGAYAI